MKCVDVEIIKVDGGYRYRLVTDTGVTHGPFGRSDQGHAGKPFLILKSAKKAARRHILRFSTKPTVGKFTEV